MQKQINESIAVKDYVRFNPDPETEGRAVQFRLVYRGKLPAASSSDNRTKFKHDLRRQLHLQLKELWSRHPALIERMDDYGHEWFDIESAKYDRCGFRFLPLLTGERGLACSLDIVFIRRDLPGKVITSGGDIDNRLKVLFDALRIPANGDEIPRGWVPSEDEKPLYCLMDDDKLVTELSVTTDQLLTPLEGDEAVNDVVLIIKVTAVLTDFGKAPWSFLV